MRVALFVVLAFVAVAAARTTLKNSDLDAKASSLLRGLLERNLSEEAQKQKAAEIADKIRAQTKGKDVGQLRSVLLKKTNRFSAHKRTESEEDDHCSAYEPICDGNDPEFWECAVIAAFIMEFTFDDIYKSVTGEKLFSDCMADHLIYFRWGDHCFTLEEQYSFEELYDYIATEKFTDVWDKLTPETQDTVAELECQYTVLRDEAYEVASGEN